MIAAGIFLLAAQATSSAPPPVVVVDTPIQQQPVNAISWKCEAMLSHQGGNLVLTGQFPAVSVEAQKNGGAFRLQTAMTSDQDKRFSGTFPAALTSNASIPGISNYSIMIPGEQAGRPNFILTFVNFTRAKDGFVNVLKIDPASGAPSAYAAGVCKLGVKP